jgi:hypothetical protein
MEATSPFKEVTFPTPMQMVYRQAKRHTGFLIGGTVLLLIVIMALAAPILTPT